MRFTAALCVSFVWPHFVAFNAAKVPCCDATLLGNKPEKHLASSFLRGEGATPEDYSHPDLVKTTRAIRSEESRETVNNIFNTNKAGVPKQPVTTNPPKKTSPPTPPKKTSPPKRSKKGNKLATAFKQKAIIPGMRNAFTSQPVLVVSDQGIEYSVEANLTTRQGGMVSLAAVADFVKSVSCSGNDDSIVITFSESLTLAEAKVLFPHESLLLVKASTFGPCMTSLLLKGDEGPNFNAKLFAEAIAGQTGDGYLIIDKVRISGSNVEVIGHRGQFFDMFHDGHIDVTPTAQIRHNRGLFEVSYPITKTWNPFEEVPWFDFEVGVECTLTAIMEMGPISLDFGFWGFDISVTDMAEFRIQAEGKVEFSTPFIQEPIAQENPFVILEKLIAPPAVELLSLVRKAKIFDTDLKDVPEIKVGLYAELLTYWAIDSLTIEGSAPLLPTVSMSYTTGKKQRATRIFFKPFDSHDKFGMNPELIINEEAKFDANIDFPRSSPEFMFDARWVLQPQVALYFTSDVYAGLGFPAGPVLKAKAKLDTEPYGPLDPPTEDEEGIHLGYCDLCHYIEADISAEISSPLFGANFETPEIKVLGKVVFPAVDESIAKELLSSPLLEWKIAVVCLLTQFGTNTIACGDKCCDSTSQTCDDVTSECKTCDQSDPTCGGGPPNVCYSPSGNTGECKTTGSCSRVADGSNICPPGLSCCLPECDRSGTGIECCDDSECNSFADSVCVGNKCICSGECCADAECGDPSIFECKDRFCRIKNCVKGSLIECCGNNDCAPGLLCESSACIANGNPRFTLSWYGDDDLDVHIRTPAGKVIFYNSPYDPVSKGRLDHDDIPRQVGRWMENIFFPMDGSAPKGEYVYWVNRYKQIGSPDAWTLEVYLGETRVRRHIGSASESFTFTIQ